MNKKEIEQLQKENSNLKQIMLAKQFPDMNAVKVEIETDKQRIDKAIEVLEKDENKESIEVILNNVGKALDILKGGNNE